MFKYVLAVVAVFASVTANAANFERVGNDLYVRGDITLFDGWTIEDYIKDGVDHILLESDGGSAYAAQYAAPIIRDAGITTTAIGGCYSACGAMWLAGTTHTYDANGEVGFHLAWVDNDVYAEIKEDYGWNGIDYYIKNGVLNDLISDIPSINNQDAVLFYIQKMQEQGLQGHNMWRLTYADMVKLEGTFISKPRAEATPVLTELSAVRTWDSTKGMYKYTVFATLSEDTLQVQVGLPADSSGKFPTVSPAGNKSDTFDSVYWTDLTSGYKSFTFYSSSFAIAVDITVDEWKTFETVTIS